MYFRGVGLPVNPPPFRGSEGTAKHFVRISLADHIEVSVGNGVRINRLRTVLSMRKQIERAIDRSPRTPAGCRLASLVTDPPCAFTNADMSS